MLTAKTIEQIFEVIQRAKGFYIGGDTIEKAYNLACNQVSRKYGFAYQTIADGCVRRLGFKGEGATGRFQYVLRKWFDGDETELKNILIKKADKSVSSIVMDFFRGNVSSGKIMPSIVTEEPTQETEVISFRLPLTAAQQLRLLAEAKGYSSAELVSKTIIGFIDTEFRDLLAKMIKNMPTEDRQKFLREMKQ